MGAPWRVFTTFVTFPQLFAFRGRGPGMVWDAHTKTHTEPLVEKKSVPWDFTVAPPQLLAFSRANNALYWA